MSRWRACVWVGLSLAAGGDPYRTCSTCHATYLPMQWGDMQEG